MKDENLSRIYSGTALKYNFQVCYLSVSIFIFAIVYLLSTAFG